MISRADLVDLLVREDEALVLTSRQCLRLSSVAAAIVACLDEPRSRVDVEAHLELRFGPAPEGRLEDVLAELQRQGVIEMSS